jgi:hypothetical protein
LRCFLIDWNQRMYVPGTVESVDEVTPMKGMHYGFHLRLNTGGETISLVRLGPQWNI